MRPTDVITSLSRAFWLVVIFGRGNVMRIDMARFCKDTTALTFFVFPALLVEYGCDMDEPPATPLPLLGTGMFMPVTTPSPTK